MVLTKVALKMLSDGCHSIECYLTQIECKRTVFTMKKEQA